MKAHRTDGVSLSFGVIFLFILAWWTIAQFVTLALPAVGWLVAIALILFGVFGLVGAFRSGRGAVPAPTSGAPAVETVDPLHADIVRELLETNRADVPLDVNRVAATTASRTESPYVSDYLTAPTVDDPTERIGDDDATRHLGETVDEEADRTLVDISEEGVRRAEEHDTSRTGDGDRR